MKVSELIELLKTYSPELPVLVNGYKSGFQEPKEIIVQDMHYIGPTNWGGDHEECDDRNYRNLVSTCWKCTECYTPKFPALLIKR